MRLLYVALGDNDNPIALEENPRAAFFTFYKLGVFPQAIIEMDPSLFRRDRSGHGVIIHPRSGMKSTSFKLFTDEFIGEPGVRIIQREIDN